MGVVRVGTLNNFNCTEKEWAQLDGFVNAFPYHKFFVNSTINTPLIETVLDHDYPVVITLNPYVDDTPKYDLIDKLRSKIVFVRVKYVVGNRDHDDMMTHLASMGIRAVLTAMRFKSRDNLYKYVRNNELADECYEWKNSYFRIKEDIWADIAMYYKRRELNYLCDQKLRGCSECGYCATFSHPGNGIDIYELNLSTSGECEKKCPDCFAINMQKILRASGSTVIKYDSIKKNSKMMGYK